MPYAITDKCSGCGACTRICPAGAIEGAKKMRHVIAGNLCIGCGACGRICPEGALTDASGAACHPLKKSQWSKPRFDLSACLACTSCMEGCPTGAIVLAGPAAAGNPHSYPRLENPGSCIGCAFCAADCPVDAITMAAEPPPG